MLRFRYTYPMFSSYLKEKKRKKNIYINDSAGVYVGVQISISYMYLIILISNYIPNGFVSFRPGTGMSAAMNGFGMFSVGVSFQKSMVRWSFQI